MKDIKFVQDGVIVCTNKEQYITRQALMFMRGYCRILALTAEDPKIVDIRVSEIISIDPNMVPDTY